MTISTERYSYLVTCHTANNEVIWHRCLGTEGEWAATEMEFKMCEELQPHVQDALEGLAKSKLQHRLDADVKLYYVHLNLTPAEFEEAMKCDQAKLVQDLVRDEIAENADYEPSTPELKAQIEAAGQAAKDAADAAEAAAE